MKKLKSTSLYFIVNIFAMGSTFSFSNLTLADVVVPDDQIIQGSQCVGVDCVNNENFGFDTLRLKAEDITLKFEDTSTGTFPSNDWAIKINDSISGGDNHFSIIDVTGSTTVLRIDAGATGGVSIGSGSTAAANTISVGSAGNERRITNVATAISGTDAVNLDQLNAAIAGSGLEDANAYTDQLRADAWAKFDDLDREIDRVGAMSAAMSQMGASASNINQTNRVAVGVGFTGGQSAISVGLQHDFSNRTTFAFGSALSGSKASVGAGMGFGF